MTSYNERLDGILNALGERHIMVEHRLIHLGMPEQNGKNIETRKAKQAILRWVADEVIGEDISLPNSIMPMHGQTVVSIEKQKQREVLARHGYKGEDDE